MPKILDRIKRLVALGAASDGEEARTAAHIAVKLIQKHNILLCDPFVLEDTPIEDPWRGICHWCGRPVDDQAHPFEGSFYHPSCWQERLDTITRAQKPHVEVSEQDLEDIFGT